MSGTPPDLELNGLTLVNGYSARLDTQNAINLREAWLRTEIFKQRLALVGGRLDLTNFFDRNAAANDETTQFLSDALVNNPTLGLATNGSGFATILDPKNGLTLKFGFQQSNPDATSLSESLYTLVRGGLPVHDPEGWRGVVSRLVSTHEPVGLREWCLGAQSRPEDFAEDHPVWTLRRWGRADRHRS